MKNPCPRPRALTAVLAVLVILAMTLGTALIAVASAAPAQADCPVTGCPGGGPDPTPWSSQFTITPPDHGQIVATPDDGGAAITCPASATEPCTVSDSQSAVVRPTTGWPTYTLTASGGGAGMDPLWSGCDSGNGLDGNCTVLNDQPPLAGTTVSTTWKDVQAPTVDISQFPEKFNLSTVFHATATDNDSAGIAAYHWTVTSGSDGAQTTFDTTTGELAASRFADFVDTHATSDYVIDVAVYAVDQSGNMSAQRGKFIDYDDSAHINVTSAPPAAYVNAWPSVTFDPDPDIPAANVECSTERPIEPVAYQSCTSPYTPSGVELADGTWYYDLKVTDDIGNTETRRFAFTVDTQAPVATITEGPVSDIPAGPDPTFSFTTNDSGSGIASVICTMDVTSTPCSDSQRYTGLAAGPHTFILTVTDKAGNIGTVTRAFTVRARATSAPVAPVRTHVHAKASHKRTPRHHRVTLKAWHLPKHAGGRVSFTVGTRTLCVAKVHHGKAHCRTSKHLRPGKYRITTRYRGTRAYAPSVAHFTFWIRKR